MSASATQANKRSALILKLAVINDAAVEAFLAFCDLQLVFLVKAWLWTLSAYVGDRHILFEIASNKKYLR